MKFSGKVWSDHGTWLNFGSIRVNGSAGQRPICLFSPAIAHRTGVNKSVSFARWQQGAGFVVPRTTACLYAWSKFLFVFEHVWTRKRWKSEGKGEEPIKSCTERVGAGAPVYLAAVMEYLAAEVLLLAGNAARDNQKTRIIPRHLQLANDEELNKLLSGVTIAQGGVLPNLQAVLCQRRRRRRPRRRDNLTTTHPRLRWRIRYLLFGFLGVHISTGHTNPESSVVGQGGHKPGILKDFSEHGKLTEFCATSGENCNKVRRRMYWCLISVVGYWQYYVILWLPPDWLEICNELWQQSGIDSEAGIVTLFPYYTINYIQKT